MGRLHKRLVEQLAKASDGPSGELDLDKLFEFVSTAYEKVDRDRLQRLDAFDAIAEGIAVFDERDCYVLWNKRYAELYAEGGGKLEVGVRFEDALRSELERYQYVDAIGRNEEWLKERLARRRLPANTEIQHLANDRWVRIEERGIPGRGSVGIRVDITELKQREESFRLLFESNPLPMMVCAEKSLRFIAANDSAVAHYGYAREQFLQMSVFDLRTPEDRSQAQWLAQSGEGNRQAGATRRHVRADGTIIDVAIYSRPLRYDGQQATLFAAIDLTERKRAEDDVREAREFLEAIIDNVPVTVTVKSARDFRYVLINRAAEKFMGRSRDDILGKTVHDIFPKDVADAINERDRALLKAGFEVILDDRPLHTADSATHYFNSRRLTLPDASGVPRYLLGVVEDITVLKLAEGRIAHLANHDSLTGLPNRASFDQRMNETLERAGITGERFGLICLDIDRFKGINDAFGHGAGDAVLQETARRLKVVAKGAFVGRVGGDEFSLIVPEAQHYIMADLAERLQASMFAEIESEGHRLKVRLSIGIALYPLDGADAKSLTNNADAALYRSKAEGRGVIRFFDAEMDQQLRARRTMQHDLRFAVERRELALYYQPQAKMNSEILGFEVLMRWQHPCLGAIPPATFIPLAEESGTIVQMGEWALREACREAASWRRPLNIAVNLSPAQFQQGDFPAFVHSILLGTGLAAHRLEVEITEGVLIHDFPGAISMLRRLRSLGVRITMDDFGTGYSSLSYLQAFPFDKIKIDKSFIAGIKRNSQSAAIVRAMIGLGRDLDIPVVAEGVETQEQLDFLIQESCSEAQGYLIGRPMPIESYERVLGGRSCSDVRQLAPLSFAPSSSA